MVVSAFQSERFLNEADAVLAHEEEVSLEGALHGAHEGEVNRGRKKARAGLIFECHCGVFEFIAGGGGVIMVIFR